MFPVRMFLHKNIRLYASHYTGQRWCFVTICCEGRRPEFASAKNPGWVVEQLRHEAAAQPAEVFAYSAIPDHLH